MKKKIAKKYSPSARVKKKPAAKESPALPECATYKGRKLYKVLVDGKSCHGGSLTWSLPKDGKPGEWHRVAAAISMCTAGIHLTTEPARWWKPGCEIYEVAAEGVSAFDASDQKAVCVAVQLLRLVPKEEQASLFIFHEGSHRIEGTARGIALGSSRVEARGSSSVVARGSSSVVARGSSSVVAHWKSVVCCWVGTPTVTLNESACFVDQRGAKPVLTFAEAK